jgi:hypothetical protein
MSVFSLVIVVAAVWWYVVAIPADNFALGHKRLDAWRDSHPALRWTVLVAKNLLGFLMILAGMTMIVTPGPGWLAIILGLGLVDVPGKRHLERRIIQAPGIRQMVDRARAKAGKPPLVF